MPYGKTAASSIRCPSDELRMMLANPKLRSFVLQALALLITVSALAMLGQNVAQNLAKQGVASGFEFLGRTAGFDIIQHLIPYNEEASYGRAFAVALLNTLLVSGVGVFLATILGFLIGVARLSSNWLISRLALVYIEVIRNVPLLLQLFFWYFGVLRTLPGVRDSYVLSDKFFLNIRGFYVPAPIFEAGFTAFAGITTLAMIGVVVLIKWAARRELNTARSFPAWRVAASLLALIVAGAYVALGRPIGWDIPELAGFNFTGGMSLLPELVALLLALTTYTAAFIAEIVRAGILAVSRGQWEAALALGLTRAQVLRFVVIPQAMRVIIPPMTNQFLNLTKNSSLAAAIAYPDLVLVFAGTVLMQTGQAVEVIAITMAVYLIISLTISVAMNRYNERMALVER